VPRFYSSLHANLADVYLRLGQHNQARQHVERARAVEAALPDDGYGQMIRRLIARLSEAVPPAR
jgi:hypothetical protein